MSMLSRVAERVYWLGRYLERAENTARLVSVYGDLLLDLPRSSRLVWESLVAITGSRVEFAERYANAEERNVVKFYLADQENSSSIVSSVAAARENARTVREVVPSSTWEGINDLHIYIEDNLEGGLGRRGRDAFLNHVIQSCQFIVGCLAGTMSRDAAYQFLRAGRYLERADMTSRIVDVGSANVFPWQLSHHDLGGTSTDDPYANILWMSVLRSLNALQMYRRVMPEHVRADRVVAFLLQDESFPRAVAHCLQVVRACLRQLPSNASALATADQGIAWLQAADVGALLQQGLFDFIDAMQIEFNALHAVMREAWFLPEEVTA